MVGGVELSQSEGALCNLQVEPGGYKAIVAAGCVREITNLIFVLVLCMLGGRNEGLFCDVGMAKTS